VEVLSSRTAARQDSQRALRSTQEEALAAGHALEEMLQQLVLRLPEQPEGTDDDVG
jgi:hypothetical protein